jgi:hypothetical protein
VITCSTKGNSSEFYDYQTPNFALDCDDIPKSGVRPGTHPEMPFRITMQNLEPDGSRCPVPDTDTLFTAPEESLPPAIILDYVFGAAAYKLWRSNPDESHEKMRAYHEAHYQVIPHQESTRHPIPDSPSSEQEGTDEWRRELHMLDQMNLALTLLKTSPKKLAMEVRKRQEEEELREREASRAKVSEWIGNVNVLDPVATVDMDVTG